MKRSHRLLRSIHRIRVERFPLAANRRTYEAYEDVDAFDELTRALVLDGLVDRATFHAPVLKIFAVLQARLEADMRPGGVLDQVGQAIAAVAFADRRGPDGRYALGGGYRSTAEGCAAAAQAAILDRVLRAVAEVMRRRALIDHREDPCWPAAYVKRQAEAENARLGIGDDDPAPDPDASAAGS